MSGDQQNFNAQPPADDDLPDWLHEIRGTSSQPKAQSAVESSEMPLEEEMAASAVDLPPAPAVSDSNETDDDWQKILAAEGIELDGLSEDRPEGAEDMTIQDWLAATSEESPLFGKQWTAEAPGAGPETTETAASEVASEPAFEVASEPASESVSEPTSSGGEADDDWQKILAAEGIELDGLSEERPEGAEDMTIQDWLAATSEESPLFGKQWTAEAPSLEPAIAADADDISLTGSDDEAEAALEAALDAALETAREAEPSAEAVAALADDIVIEDELPDWLREDQLAEAGEATASVPTIESGPAEDEFAEAAFANERVADDGLSDRLPEDQPVEAAIAPPLGSPEESGPAEVEAGLEVETTTEVETVFADDARVEDPLPDWLHRDLPAPAPDGPILERLKYAISGRVRSILRSLYRLFR